MKNQESIKLKKRRFWIRLAAFLPILILILLYAVYVLTPKYDYGICSMLNLYRQPKNSIDVLSVGTSQTYGGINTNILWDDYGIASYNLATAEQAYWVAYYYIKEALKFQTPKVILLDAKAAAYPDDKNTNGRTILATFGILSPMERIAAIEQCAKSGEAMDFITAFPKIHSYIEGITPESFTLPPDNNGRGGDWKGYIEQDNTEKHERPSFVWNSTKKEVNEHEAEYFLKILELCNEKKIPVLMVSYPYPDYAHDHMYVNSILEMAKQYGVQGLNYNNPDIRFGLRYSSDFADWQHLNIKGSANFSRRLAEDIKNMFDIPDRRGDAYYSSYDSCSEKWFSLYPEYRRGYID